MKIRYLFSLVALAIIMAACSSDENTQESTGRNGQKMPFTATISVGDATTRSLTEATDGSAITTSWKKDEQVALIHNGQIDVMTVTEVNEETKAATIQGDITSATNGEAVTIVYPASAVDQDTKAVKADLLKSQDGSLATISEKLDYRTATTTLAVSEGGSTFGSSVTLALQNAIWKLSLTDGTNAIKATQVNIVKGEDELMVMVMPEEGTFSEFYVAVPAVSNGTINISAATSEGDYTYTKTGVTLEAGKYYVSTMAMNAPEPEKMTVNATGYKGTYDAQAHGITVTVTEPATGATIKYGEKEGEYNLDESPTYTDAGKHTVYYQVTMDKYETVTGSADVEITQAAATINFKEATITKTYGDAAFTNTLTNTGDGAVKYSTTATNVTVNESTGEVTITGAGEATIKATVTDGTNYTYATKEVSYTLTVKAPTSTVGKPDNYDHGENNPF